MTTQFPSHARVVIVGGGVIGTSIAYHLAKLGWTDIVLLERDSGHSSTPVSCMRILRLKPVFPPASSVSVTCIWLPTKRVGKFSAAR
jgi:flavin-dependent dehydrogenase